MNTSKRATELEDACPYSVEGKTGHILLLGSELAEQYTFMSIFISFMTYPIDLMCHKSALYQYEFIRMRCLIPIGRVNTPNQACDLLEFFKFNFWTGMHHQTHASLRPFAVNMSPSRF